MGRGRLRLALAALVAALCVFPAAASAQDDGPDGEVVDLLKQLIQTNTSNPPGNERQIAELLQARLAPLGFETEIIPTPTPGKAHFIARLRAANPTAKPLLLAGHEDVVGVERELWSVDPFAGLVRGGDIFGRGSMDFKGGLAAFTVAASRIARAKPALTRDVILLAEADEEGGDYGTGWLAKTNYAKIDAGVSLNEGGWVLRGRRRHPAPDGDHHDRQELAVGDARDARHLDALLTAAARLRARPPHPRAQPHRALRAGDAEALQDAARLPARVGARLRRPQRARHPQAARRPQRQAAPPRDAPARARQLRRAVQRPAADDLRADDRRRRLPQQRAARRRPRRRSTSGCSPARPRARRSASSSA